MTHRWKTEAATAVALVAAAALAGCHPKSLAQGEHDMISGELHGGVHVQTSERLSSPVHVVDRLECPEAEGALRRTTQSADGRACSYSSSKGVVDLSLLPDGAADPAAALAPIKAKVDALLPREANGGTVTVSTETGADGKERSKVDLPFIHVRDNGKHSHVQVFGMTVDSDDDDRNRTGNVTASARSGGVEDVYVLAGAKPSSEGYHAVGYVARGGETGALLVGAFKYRNGEDMGVRGGRDHDRDGDFDRLMDLNAPKG